MATRIIGLGIAGLLGMGCLSDPLEGSHSAAEEGTRVEVMLVPLDDGADLSQGAEAFDAELPTTESLEDLARGGGAFVVGVADGWGIALVPTNLTDDALEAADAREPDANPDGTAQDDEPWQDDTPDPASCAGDCAVWCTTSLDLCDGDGAALCDCSAADDPADPNLPADPEEPACTWDCAEWCTTTLDYCDDDGAFACDCSGDDAFGSAEDPSCALDCAEWCSTTLELCDGDGWDLCGDTCEWTEARALPASASAGGWVAPIVVGGIALVIVMTDPEVQAALDRGESIGSAVGGTYGRRAEVIMERLRALRGELGDMTDDARRSCADLLTRQGYRERLEVSAGDSIRVGICSQDQLTVWPRDLTIRAAGQQSATVTFQNLGSGFRTVLTRDATVGWTEGGRAQSATVPEGGGTSVTLPLQAGSFPLTVAVPRDSSSANVAVTVVR